MYYNKIMDGCIFCKIVKGEIPANKIYEDETSLAFLDITPINPGHILLIPKEHHKNIYDMPDNILSKIAPVIKKLSIALKSSVNADGINIGMNNDGSAGQVVFHAHFHIMPRFSDDGYRLWHGKEYKDGEAQQIAEKIKKFI